MATYHRVPNSGTVAICGEGQTCLYPDAPHYSRSVGKLVEGSAEPQAPHATAYATSSTGLIRAATLMSEREFVHRGAKISTTKVLRSQLVEGDTVFDENSQEVWTVIGTPAGLELSSAGVRNFSIPLHGSFAAVPAHKIILTEL